MTENVGFKPGQMEQLVEIPCDKEEPTMYILECPEDKDYYYHYESEESEEESSG